MKVTTRDPEFHNSLLLVDPGYRAYQKTLLTAFKDWKITLKPDPREATNFFFHNEVNLVLLGHSAESPCLDLLNFFKSVKPSVPVIVLTDCGSEELVVSVFRNGASDYFRKPFPPEELKRSIETAFRTKKQIEKYPPGEGIFKAIRYIQENFATHLRLSQIARESAMSLSSFERTFKKEMGTTYSKFLNRFRISKAARMLQESNLSINEVAFACGFTNPYHFSRMFRRIMQVSPRNYRKSLKGLFPTLPVPLPPPTRRNRSKNKQKRSRRLPGRKVKLYTGKVILPRLPLIPFLPAGKICPRTIGADFYHPKASRPIFEGAGKLGGKRANER